MDNYVANRKSKLDIWMLMLVTFLMVPTYYYVGGMNVSYLYPVFLFLFYALTRMKLFIPRSSGNFLIIFYFIYLTVVAFCQRGVLYGIVTAISTLGVLYLVLISITDQKKLLKFLDTIVFVVFISCMLGLVESIMSVNVFQLLSNSGWEFFKEYRMGHLRIAVQFSQPIVFGYYILLLSPLVFFRMVNNDTMRKQRFAKVTYILMCVNMVLTFSRAVMVAFFLLQLFYTYQLGNRKFVFRVFIICAILCLLLIIDSLLDFGLGDMASQFWEMFAAIGGSESTETYSGVGDRLDIFAWVIETVGDNHWFGKGIDAQFSYEVYEWQIKESIENEYLNTFFHYGIIGVSIQIMTYLGNLVYCFKLQRKIRTDQGKFNLINAIFWCLLVFYIIIFTAGQSAAITTHIFVIGIAMAYGCLWNKGVVN